MPGRSVLIVVLVLRRVSCCWFLVDNSMHVNFSLRKVSVYKMAVSMGSVVRWAGEIWKEECEMFAPLALRKNGHVSFCDLVGVHTTLSYSV
jgi:hypothetical protein